MYSKIRVYLYFENVFIINYKHKCMHNTSKIIIDQCVCYLDLNISLKIMN